MLTLEDKERIFFDAFINFEGQYNADFLMKLLFGNVDPDHVINDEILWSTKLHIAVISKDCTLALVQNILVEDSAQLNQKNIFQVTPLHRAVYCARDLAVVIELLKHGAHVNAVERSMMSSLHIAAYHNNKYQLDLLQTLLEYGGNINCVDYKNQTPLHMLVKHRNVQEQSLCLLLQNGANPNAFDKDNNSVLRVAILNKYISLNVIKTLLAFGANPEEHIKYCSTNLPVAKLLIQYLAIKKLASVFMNTTEGSFDLLPNQLVDLSFCSDIKVYFELSNFRDNCINELMAMRKIKVFESYTLFQFISDQCCNARIRDINKNMNLVEDALLSLKCDNFSYCNNLIDAAFEFQEVLNILSEQGVYAMQSGTPSINKRIYLNYYTISDLASYITKNDFINLAIAYMSKNSQNVSSKSDKRKLCYSKSTKRLHEGLSDSMMCMKRLKL